MTTEQTEQNGTKRKELTEQVQYGMEFIRAVLFDAAEVNC